MCDCDYIAGQIWPDAIKLVLWKWEHGLMIAWTAFARVSSCWRERCMILYNTALYIYVYMGGYQAFTFPCSSSQSSLGIDSPLDQFIYTPWIPCNSCRSSKKRFSLDAASSSSKVTFVSSFGS